MIISDWMHYTAEMFAAGLPTREPGPLPVNVLINGKGPFFDEVCSFNKFSIASCPTRSYFSIVFVKPNMLTSQRH